MHLCAAHLPPFELKWQPSSDGKSVITPCLARKKTVALEPEEWVRQHWLHYLSNDLGYPLSLTSVELPLDLNGQSQFADVVCHAPDGRALLMVELKRPDVALSKTVLDQVLRYHGSADAAPRDFKRPAPPRLPIRRHPIQRPRRPSSYAEMTG